MMELILKFHKRLSSTELILNGKEGWRGGSDNMAEEFVSTDNKPKQCCFCTFVAFSANGWNLADVCKCIRNYVSRFVHIPNESF